MRRMYSENQVKTLAKESVESGAVNLPISQIVDENGHNRFIEGDINLSDELVGFTKLYGKWSLSGSHLLIVLSFSVDDATAFVGRTICEVNLTQWIKDKIEIIYGNIVIPTQTIRAGNSDGSTEQNFGLAMRKQSGNITLYMNSITTTDTRYCRVQFDLLIDTE